jgi:hypothetical protein
MKTNIEKKTGKKKDWRRKTTEWQSKTSKW